MHCETPIRRSLLQTGSPRAAENSNRYTVRIEFPVSYRKQRTGAGINRHNFRASCAPKVVFSSHSPLVTRHCSFNRNISLIEPLVSHSKQRTAPQINRNISRWSQLRLPLFISCFPSFAEAEINRQPDLVDRLVSYSKQRAGPQINRQLSCPESAAVRRSNGSGTLAARESGFPIPNTLRPKPCPASPGARREIAACGDHIGQGPAARLRMPGHDLSFQNTCGAAMMLVKRMMPEAKFLRLRVFVLQRRLGVKNDAKTQVGKKQLGSFGTRAGLHGHEFFVRAAERQEGDD